METLSSVEQISLLLTLMKISAEKFKLMDTLAGQTLKLSILLKIIFLKKIEIFLCIL